MAGKITANVVQLGDSATASQNFHLKTNVDGSLSLNRGNVGASLGTILSVNTNGVVSQQAQSMVRLNTANGYGTTNTKIRRYSNVVVNQGSDITYADSTALGASFTINKSGVYAISYTDQNSGSSGFFGVSVNSTQLTTNIFLISSLNRLSENFTSVGNTQSSSVTAYLSAGDVVRPHTDAGSTSTDARNQFTIVRVA